MYSATSSIHHSANNSKQSTHFWMIFDTDGEQYSVHNTISPSVQVFRLSLSKSRAFLLTTIGLTITSSFQMCPFHSSIAIFDHFGSSTGPAVNEIHHSKSHAFGIIKLTCWYKQYSCTIILGATLSSNSEEWIAFEEKVSKWMTWVT
jgi:hypothetical protein